MSGGAMGKIPPHAQRFIWEQTEEQVGDRTPKETLGTIGTTEGETERLSGS